MLGGLNPVVPSPEVCVKCKGRLWCGPRCFILERFERKQGIASGLKCNSVSGPSPPGVFVSWSGYPKVSFSPLASSGSMEPDAWLADDSDKWFGLPAERIISFRESLVRGSIFLDARQATDPTYQLQSVQETLMAKRPVGVEMRLKSAPKFRGLSFSDFHAPMGPQAELKNFSLVQNPAVNQAIEKFFYDTDAKSLQAMVGLFDNGVGVNQLHKILSAGMIGEKKNRRIVPTRWSIVAVDSGLSEYLIEEKIKHFSKIECTKLFFSSYLENYFFVILVPGKWGYELLEVYKPGASWNAGSLEPRFMSDFEFFEGQKGYAQNTAGGYYAVRMAVAEFLAREKNQATVIVFREIGDSGLPSVGVWKCREIVRDALKKSPLSFSGPSLALKYLEAKLSIPLNHWVKNSMVLDRVFHQKKLNDFA